MNAANWITVGRVALVPVFIFLAYLRTDSGAVAALLVFALASASDRLDGQLARRHGTVSRLGEFLDPTADKLLVGAALFVLVDLHDFPLWAAGLIAVREAAVMLLRTRIVTAGGTLPASPMGKAKTVVQVGMVCWWLYPAEPALGHWFLLAAGVGLTVVSGIEYFMRSIKRTQKASA